MKNKTIVAALLVGLVVLSLFALAQGAIRIPVSHVIQILTRPASELSGGGESFFIKDSHIFIVRHVRVPRILVAIAVGGLLSLIGAVFQAIFRNPMADPFVMGVSSGAAFGATIGIVFGMRLFAWLGGMFAGIGMTFAGGTGNLIGMSLVSILAFLGAIGSIFIVYTLASHRGRVSPTAILLAGIVLSAVLSAFISLMMILNEEDAVRIVRWTMGSFNGANWDQVFLIALPLLIGGGYLITLSRELNAMSLSENEARGMGVDVERVKRNSLLLSSFLAAVTVSVSGIIGFVGLIVPHFFRMLVGSNHRILLPVSFLGGALFLLACDTIARSFVFGMEIPVGIVTSVVGGPFFMVLLQRYKRRAL
ncbi:MAG: iron ABC transporter permease [Bacillota bacterium]|nr:iron ABC transporter permease [Bacillota bacterium]